MLESSQFIRMYMWHDSYVNVINSVLLPFLFSKYHSKYHLK